VVRHGVRLHIEDCDTTGPAWFRGCGRQRQVIAGALRFVDIRIHADGQAGLDAAGAGLTALGSPVERGETELRTITPEGIAPDPT
jgi:hypothetical protein